MEKDNGEISAWGWSVNEITTTPSPIHLGPPPRATGRAQPERAASSWRAHDLCSACAFLLPQLACGAAVSLFVKIRCASSCPGRASGLIRRTVRHLSASRDLHLHGQHGCRAEQRPPRAKLWTHVRTADRRGTSRQPGSRVCRGFLCGFARPSCRQLGPDACGALPACCFARAAEHGVYLLSSCLQVC